MHSLEKPVVPTNGYFERISWALEAVFKQYTVSGNSMFFDSLRTWVKTFEGNFLFDVPFLLLPKFAISWNFVDAPNFDQEILTRILETEFDRNLRFECETIFWDWIWDNFWDSNVTQFLRLEFETIFEIRMCDNFLRLEFETIFENRIHEKVFWWKKWTCSTNWSSRVDPPLQIKTSMSTSTA